MQNETKDSMTKIPSSIEEQLPWTFEVSWDVVGNADNMCTIRGKRNILVGPYRADRIENEVHEMEFPAGSPLAAAIESVRNLGFRVVTGIWRIKGSPPAILFDINTARNIIGNGYKNEFQKDRKIDIPDDDTETDEAVIFGYLIAEFLYHFESKCVQMKPETTSPELTSPEITNPKPTNPETKLEPETTSPKTINPETTVQPTAASPKTTNPEEKPIPETSPTTTNSEAKREPETSPQTTIPEKKLEPETSPQTTIPETKPVPETSPQTTNPEEKLEQETSPQTTIPETKPVPETSPQTTNPEAKREPETSPQTTNPEAKLELEPSPKTTNPEAKLELEPIPKTTIPETTNPETKLEPEITSLKITSPKITKQSKTTSPKTGRFVKIRKTRVQPKFSEVTAQFHDWNCSPAIVFINQRRIAVATVFTLHDNKLGKNFQPKDKIDDEARHQGIYHRLSILRVAVQMADLFTTFTEEVAEEAVRILKRKPNIVVIPTERKDSDSSSIENLYLTTYSYSTSSSGDVGCFC